MRSAGYTLVELLVVISIMAILGVAAFVNFKDFAADQVTVKAVGQVQTYLRLAQSNATSGYLCATIGGASWSAQLNSNEVKLFCDKTGSEQQTLNLENATISVGCLGGTSLPTLPVSIKYAALLGTVSFEGEGSGSCTGLVVTVTNSRNSASPTKTFTISKGGAINVQ